MAEIGSVTVSVEPVLDEEALEQMAKRVQDEVKNAVRRGIAKAVRLDIAKGMQL